MLSLQKYKNVNVTTIMFLMSGDLTGLCLYIHHPLVIQLRNNPLLQWSLQTGKDGRCRSSMEDLGSISPALQQTCLDVWIAVLMSNKERIRKARRKTEEKWYYTLSLSLFVCLSLTLSLYVFICYKKACPRKGTHSSVTTFRSPHSSVRFSLFLSL